MLIAVQIEEIEAQAQNVLAETFGSGGFPPIPVNVNAVAGRLGLSLETPTSKGADSMTGA